MTRDDRRAQLARQIGDMRPTIDNTHDAVLQATGDFGVTYEALASATGTNVTRVQRWSAGADLPERVSERRAILSVVAGLLNAMQRTPDRRRKDVRELADQARWRRAEERIAAEGADVLCLQCQRRRQTGDDVCGRRACRLQIQGLSRLTKVNA